MIQQEFVGSAKGCTVHSVDIDMNFLSATKRHFETPLQMGENVGGTSLVQRRGQGQNVARNSVLGHNEGLLIMKSISLDLNPNETFKELAMNTVTANTTAESVVQVVPMRLLTVEDIAAKMGTSASHVYHKLHSLGIQPQQRDGKTGLYPQSLLKELLAIPRRQRKNRRNQPVQDSVQGATQQPGSTTPMQQQPTSETSKQQYAEGSLLERMAHLEQTMAAQAATIAAQNATLEKMSAAFQQQQETIQNLSKILGA